MTTTAARPINTLKDLKLWLLLHDLTPSDLAAAIGASRQGIYAALAGQAPGVLDKIRRHISSQEQDQ